MIKVTSHDRHGVSNNQPLYGLSNSLWKHWDRNEIAAISQTTFSNAFSWIENAWFLFLRFHLNLFLKFENLYWDYCSAPNRRHANISTNGRELSLLTHICVNHPQWVEAKTQETRVLMPFVTEIHRWRVDSPHKGPVIWKVFPVNTPSDTRLLF